MSKREAVFREIDDALNTTLLELSREIEHGVRYCRIVYGREIIARLALAYAREHCRTHCLPDMPEAFVGDCSKDPPSLLA